MHEEIDSTNQILTILVVRRMVFMRVKGLGDTKVD